MAESGAALDAKGETANYKRINRLLQGMATSAVKEMFDKEFAPNKLQSTLKNYQSSLILKKLRDKGFINQYQFTLLFPKKGMPTSTDFDLTLMICLLRNLAEVDISDILPNAKDTSEAASLSRLKYYRNQVVHSQTFSLSDKEFKQYWDDITNAICILRGERYRDKCMELRYGPLDDNEKDIHLEIKKIAKSIREPNREEYFYWIEDTERYFPISAAIESITDAFKQNHFIKNLSISISSVNNPDMIYEHLALKTQINMQSNISDQRKVHVTGASQKEKKRKGIDDPQKRKKQIIQPKSSNYIECDDSQGNKTNLTKQIFVIDDFWEDILVDDSCYIIATCREEISKTSQFTSVGDISKFGEFNLSSNLKETMNDKIEIASCHMNPVTTQILFAEKQIQNVDRFHTLCFLYSHLLETENIAFFKNPNCVLEQEFQEIRTRSEPCYIGLALLTIYDGTLTKPLLDLKK
ncbi:unnamed protein product [Mytilus edulis]|uniref:DZIP3-like HEPN domain-containing protein n=1 Tax=Mytilus edulis TaxID=6550 RepID=A0A8S3U7C2_MYTED|nr:unnamed protein product [Mytilus edulis]